MRVAVIFGTRPEYIKVVRLIAALRALSIQVTAINTGQHRDLLNPLFRWFEIEPDLDLKVMSERQRPSQAVAKIMSSLEPYIANFDLAIVQGDTATAFGSALCAFLNRIPVAHVEAGLRTFDKFNPFPEEAFRQKISILASLHFPPTKRALNNLKAEGITDGVHQVGNTVIDALKWSLIKDTLVPSHVQHQAGKKILLVTMHRRENIGDAHREIAEAIADFIEEQAGAYQAIFPLHANPAVQEVIRPILGGKENIQLIAPLEYPDLVHLMKRAHIIATDSGGIQEEATSLGIPTIVLRSTTERPEAIESGVCLLGGTDYDSILSKLRALASDSELYQSMNRPSNVFGDGESSREIAQIVRAYLSAIPQPSSVLS